MLVSGRCLEARAAARIKWWCCAQHNEAVEVKRYLDAIKNCSDMRRLMGQQVQRMQVEVWELTRRRVWVIVVAGEVGGWGRGLSRGWRDGWHGMTRCVYARPSPHQPRPAISRCRPHRPQPHPLI